MSDEFGAEETLLRQMTRAFVEKERAKNPTAEAQRPDNPVSGRTLTKALEIGLFRTSLPEELGGMGRKIGPLCAVLEEASRSDAGLAVILFTNALAQEFFLAAGAQSALGARLGSASDVRSTLLACPAFFDPGAADLSLTASIEDGVYALTGSLDYVTGATLADQFVVPAKTGIGDDYGLFVVNASDRGLQISRPIFSLGLRSCPSADLVFERVRAEPIGEADRGAEIFENARDRMFVAAAAVSAGILAGCLDEAYAYSRERSQGGREIIHWGAVRMMLAEMAISLKVARMAVAQAARAVDEKHSDGPECALAAAVHVHELAVNATTDGIQVLGGAGYMTDFGQEARFRDAHQVQSLLGMVPVKKLDLIEKITKQGGWN